MEYEVVDKVIQAKRSRILPATKGSSMVTKSVVLALREKGHGLTSYFLQRAQGVLVADYNRCLTCWFLNSFDIFGFTFKMWSLFGFLRAGLSTKQPSLYIFLIIYSIGEEYRIFFHLCYTPDPFFRACIVQFVFSDFTHCVQLLRREHPSVN